MTVYLNAECAARVLATAMAHARAEASRDLAARLRRAGWPDRAIVAAMTAPRRGRSRRTERKSGRH